jgi:hypothetical protein
VIGLAAAFLFVISSRLQAQQKILSLSHGSSTVQHTLHADWSGVYKGLSSNARLSGGRTVTPNIDVIIPQHLQPWALTKQQATSWDDDTAATCQLEGIFRAFRSGSEFDLLPSAGTITIVPQGIEVVGVRRIHLDRGHPTTLVPSWNGDSVGHWEGDTLVVDTIGFNDKSWLGSDREPHTEVLHMVERMRLIEGGQYLEIDTYIEDQNALTSPYSYVTYYKRTQSDITEFVCNENIGPWKHSSATKPQPDKP